MKIEFGELEKEETQRIKEMLKGTLVGYSENRERERQEGDELFGGIIALETCTVTSGIELEAPSIGQVNMDSVFRRVYSC